MFNLPANISQRERMVRGAIGAIVLIAAVLGLGRVFFSIIGLLLIIEAALNYCGIIDIIDRFKLAGDNHTSPPPPPSSPL